MDDNVLGNIDCIIKTFPTSPIVIYIVVGGANNPMQQFPPALQMIKTLDPTVKFILLYFDPYHEHPPNVIKDVFVGYTETTRQTNETSFQYTLALPGRDESVFMFLYKRNVHVHNGDTSRDSVNIADMLRTVNAMSIENNMSMIYHDFTGREIHTVSEIFDEELKNHLDQIVYGISARQDHGCFFDLTKDNAFFAIKRVNNASMVNRPVFKMFNYYKHIINKTLGGVECFKDIKEYPRDMHKYINAQRIQLFGIYINKFKTSDMFILRQVHKRINTNDTDNKNNELYIPHVSVKLGELYKELWHEKNYETLRELVIERCEEILDKIVFLGNLDISGGDLLRFIIMDPDQTRWYNKYAEFGLN